MVRGLVAVAGLLILGCGNSNDASTITEDDLNTWVRMCQTAITVPEGTHPPGCALSPSCLHADGTGHRGGHARHDWCADTQPPNIFWNMTNPSGTGCDVEIGSRTDAIPDAATALAMNQVWEVKVDNYVCYPQFLQDKRWKQALQSLCKEGEAALSCGYHFVFAVADDVMYRRLVDTVTMDPNFMNAPVAQLADIQWVQACDVSSTFANDPDPEDGNCQAGENNL